MKPQRPEPSQSAALQAADGFANLRNNLAKIADESGDWAGIPMPIDKHELVIEPSYRFASMFKKDVPPHPDDDLKIRNVFWSSRFRSEVIIWHERDGSLKYGMIKMNRSAAMMMKTMDASFAWGIEQESKAVQLLGTLISHTQFKMYMLTGMFAEASKRSGQTYIFRRLRPTLALTFSDWSWKNAKIINDDEGRLMCGMCMHPIGYYNGSWAGAMCPTDDVIAHLMLMRGDEHMFWKRCNQHPPYRPEAGIYG